MTVPAPMVRAQQDTLREQTRHVAHSSEHLKPAWSGTECPASPRSQSGFQPRPLCVSSGAGTT